MMKIRYMLIPTLLLASAAAADAPATGVSYLRADSVDWKTILPPPAAEDSAEARAELDMVVAVQKRVSEAGIEAAKSQIKHMNVNTFADILGPWFRETELPKTEALFAEIEKESKKLVTGPAKKFYKRVRPADADKRVIGHEKEDEFSYPSGHSTRATMYAYVLGSLFPEQQKKLIERAREIGFNRIIVGAHYESDIVAGRIVGKAIAQKLLANPTFQGALAECKAEMAAARTQAAAAVH
ncbi:MAG: acid phosphatase [Phycisphaerae bacterium]